MPAKPKTDRDAILRAAVALLRAEGWDALSLRALAGNMGVATNALYHYFPDKAHLEAALGNESAQRLHAAIKRAGLGIAPRKRVRHLAEAYLRFARREPHLYTRLCCAPNDTAESNEAHDALWQEVLATVAALHGEKRAPAAAMSLWALLHGWVQLERAGVLDAEDPRAGIEFGLDAWIAAARK